MTSTDPAPSRRWQVRGPDDGDFSRWRELYQGYADFYRTPRPDTAAQQAWSWIRDPHHEVHCLLADNGNGVIAGLAHYRAFARPLTASTGCFLDDLFIDPARRGAGVADALLLELRRLAHANGWSVVRWITAPRQRPSDLQNATSTRREPAGTPTTCRRPTQPPLDLHANPFQSRIGYEGVRLSV